MNETRTIPKVRMVDVWNAFMDAGKEADNLIADLQALWKQELPGLPVPDETQLQRWLRGSTDPSALVYAMTQAKRRMARQSWGDAYHHLSFISAVNNRRIAEKLEQDQQRREHMAQLRRAA